jgi:hypothetical protein
MVDSAKKAKGSGVDETHIPSVTEETSRAGHAVPSMAVASQPGIRSPKCQRAQQPHGALVRVLRRYTRHPVCGRPEEEPRPQPVAALP